MIPVPETRGTDRRPHNGAVSEASMSLAQPLIEAGGATQTDEKRKAAAAKRKLLIGAALCTTFMLVEVIGAPAHAVDG